mmetsp:Transcript_16432/g.39431  ORF Transcript_16432/g.39431 Transcript_16432/m.39431 type:complete len:271 (-) Transcript_16432:53-865(-)
MQFPSMRAPPANNRMDGQPLLLHQAASGDDIFQNLSTLLVKQEFAMKELCGIEAKNRYRISAGNSPQPVPFLYAKEQSQCLERVCCSPCRALTINVHAGSDDTGEVLLSMEKQAHCPMMPWPILCACHAWPIFVPWLCIAARDLPTMVVRKGDEVIGSVIDPPMALFYCNANARILDAEQHTIFVCGPVSLCTCGIVCACCSDMEVPITAADSGEHVATITRKALTFAECMGNFNRFAVDFGSVQDPTHRALILAAGMLFDLQYWDQKEN